MRFIFPFLICFDLECLNARIFILRVFLRVACQLVRGLNLIYAHPAFWNMYINFNIALLQKTWVKSWRESVNTTHPSWISVLLRANLTLNLKRLIYNVSSPESNRQKWIEINSEFYIPRSLFLTLKPWWR